MAQGRQAKILTPRQETAILRHLETTRYPERDRVIFLLSLKAGMRAREIAALTWAMAIDANGQVDDAIALENRASKGTSGRLIPLHPLLREALAKLHEARGEQVRPERAVVYSERGLELSAATVRLWFYRLYQTLGMIGCSSHSGRRTFITRAARKVSEVGGSVRDVQQLAGHPACKPLSATSKATPTPSVNSFILSETSRKMTRIGQATESKKCATPSRDCAADNARESMRTV